MTYLGALVVGLLVHQGLRERWPARRAGGAAICAALVAARPISILPVAAAWTMVWLHAKRNRSSHSAALRPDHLGQVLFVALSAGLPVATALEFAAGEVGPDEAGEVRSVLRAARHHSLAVALAGAGGSTGRLFAVLAGAQTTGASSLRAVAAFIDEDRSARRARAAEAAQRLPIKLTVPLALLILPGFVLLTFGPTVIATVQRLLGPLLS